MSLMAELGEGPPPPEKPSGDQSGQRPWQRGGGNMFSRPSAPRALTGPGGGGHRPPHPPGTEGGGGGYGGYGGYGGGSLLGGAGSLLSNPLVTGGLGFLLGGATGGSLANLFSGLGKK